MGTYESLYYPNFRSRAFDDNSTWLTIIPKKVVNINLNARDGSFLVGDADPEYQYNYNFLLPKDFSISTSHTWKEFTNIIGVAKESIVKTIGAYRQTEAIIKKLGSMSVTEINGTPISASEIAMKSDSPVVYENSDRKRLNVTISLSTYSDPFEDVFDPIQDLLRMSSAEVKNGDLINFDFPYCFHIMIGCPNGPPSSMFEIKNAVIVRINPTYNAPYIKGYPSSAQVNIEFEDVDPLYRSISWDNNKVSVDFGDAEQEIFNSQIDNGIFIEDKNTEYWQRTLNNYESVLVTRSKALESNPITSSNRFLDPRADEIKAKTIGTLNTQNIRYWLPYAGLIKTIVPPLGG